MRLALIIFFCSWIQCHAHIVQQLFVDFEAEQETWSATIRFDAGIALPAMRADKEAPQPPRQWLVEQPASEQAILRDEAEKYLRQCLRFSDQDTPVDWNIRFPEWDTQPPNFRTPFTDLGFAYFDVELSGMTPAKSLTVTISDGDHPDWVFSNGTSLLTVEPGHSIPLWQASSTTSAQSQNFWNFLSYGYRHVLPKGWDHVLFITALCCLHFTWRSLLVQSLIFTLGHTLTMALSITHTLPALTANSTQCVEIAIAATIVYVALENVFTQKVRSHRLITIFLFGLIHGLGFAAVLGNTIQASNHIALPLIAANLGVELGQVSVIAMTFIALYWFRKKHYFPILLKGVSCCIAIMGIYWMIERIS